LLGDVQVPGAPILQLFWLKGAVFNMRSPIAESLICAASLTLLSGCASGVATPSGPFTSQQSPSFVDKGSSSCPCIYVTNDGLGGQPPDAVLVFAGNARHNATPIQDITGANTHLRYPYKIAVDASGKMYVINVLATDVLVYAAGSTGNVAPIADINGPKTNLFSPSGIAVSPLNGDIYVANQTNGKPHTPGNQGYVLIFPPKATGDMPPIGMIAGGKTNLDDPIGIAFDATGELYVANQLGRKGIAVFAAGSVGNVAPTQIVAGKATQLAQAQQAVPDASLAIHAVSFGAGEYGKSVVLTFAAGANGDVAPLQQIDDAHALGIALDSASNSYVPKFGQRGAQIAVFPPGANGHPKPTYVIECSSCMSNIGGIAIK
jgi:hypothetical protein